jgi:YD repeat-containing protein
LALVADNRRAGCGHLLIVPFWAGHVGESYVQKSHSRHFGFFDIRFCAVSSFAVSTYSTGSSSFNVSVAYTYNADGSKATAAEPSGTFGYGYDVAGRPTSVTNPFSKTTSWSDAHNKWISGQSLGNGGTTSYTLNARMRLRSR